MSNFFRLVCRSFLFSVILVGGSALLTAQETAAVQPATGTLPEVPSYHSQWMNASIPERQRLAEELGEAGAKRFAAAKGWEPILTNTDKAMRQGFDQVYRSGDGLIHVVEAKGGTSSLGNGYGYRQGTTEWAVKAAEKTLKNHAATEAEKFAAREVLKAAANGKLNVHVVRTPHVLGKPGATVVESMLKTTPEAKMLAKQCLEAAVVRSTGEGAAVATKTVARTTKTLEGAAEGTAMGLGRTVVKGAPAVGVAVEVGIRGYGSYQTEMDYANGNITGQQRVENHAGNVGGCVGGVSGAYAGASGGAMVGATAGSVVPVVGTAIGGAVGGIIGGIGGYMCGDYAGEKAGRTAMRWFR